MHNPTLVNPDSPTPKNTGTSTQDSGELVAPSRPLTKSFEPAPLVAVVPEHELSPAQLTELLESHARKLYPAKTDSPYHNWDHAFVDVKNHAKTIVKRLKDADLALDEVALYHAILCHDILHGLNSSLLQFGTKEQLASHYTYNLLRSLGAPDAHARKVEAIINATHHSIEPQSVEEIAIRAADLAGLAGDFATFIEHTRRLHQEERNSTGKDISFADFARSSLGFLPLYVWRFLQLSDAAKNERGSSVWHERTLNNMVALFSAINSGRDNIHVVAQVPLNGTHADIMASLEANAFFIGIDSDPLLLENSVSESLEFRARTKSAIPTFFVPGSSRALPLGDSICDELHVTSLDNFSVNEFHRTLRAGGALIIYAADAAHTSPQLIEEIVRLGFSREGNQTEPLRFVKL